MEGIYDDRGPAVHLCEHCECVPCQCDAEAETDPGRDCEATLEDWMSTEPELTTAERMNDPEVAASLEAANDRPGTLDAWFPGVLDQLRDIDIRQAPRAPCGLVISTRSDAICAQIDAFQARQPDPECADLAALKALVFELLDPIAPNLVTPIDGIASTLGASIADVWRVLDGSDRFERVCSDFGMAWRISWWQRLREQKGVLV